MEEKSCANLNVSTVKWIQFFPVTGTAKTAMSCTFDYATSKTSKLRATLHGRGLMSRAMTDGKQELGMFKVTS